DALAVGELLVLHEYEIPDFDEAIALRLRTTRRSAPDMIAVIVEDFRTRTARPGIAHCPEIVAASDPQDFLFGQAGDLPPKRECLIVVDIDGDEQTIGRYAVFLGDKSPSKLDRALLEIIAEREITEHFEEGVMAGGIAYIVEVIVLAAIALEILRRHRARIGTLFQAGENVFELHHAGI